MDASTKENHDILHKRAKFREMIAILQALILASDNIADAISHIETVNNQTEDTKTQIRLDYPSNIRLLNDNNP
jgi:hypothetical protein